MDQAKRIRSAFEEQISSARAKHLEETNHLELRTQELIQAKREHEHSLDSLSTLMKTTVQKVRRDSVERYRCEFEEANRKAQKTLSSEKSKAKAEIEDMEDLVRHHRGECETSSRRHVRRLREVEEEHKRVLTDRKHEHLDAIQKLKDEHHT